MLVLLNVLVFFLSALILFVLQEKQREAREIVVFAAAIFSLALLFLFWNDLVSANRWLEFETTNFLTAGKLNFHLAAGSLSILLAGLTVLLTLASRFILAGRNKNSARQILFINGLAAGLFFSQNPLTFYFFWSLLLLFCFLKIVNYKNVDSNYFNYKFILMTMAGNILFFFCLLGFALADTGWSRGVPPVDLLLRIKSSFANPGLIFWGLFLGLALSLPVIPAHGWFVDLVTRKQYCRVVLFGVLLPGAAIFGLIRFWLPLFPSYLLFWRYLLSLASIAGIIYTGFLAWIQVKPGKLLAYAMLSQLHFSLLGIIIGQRLTVIAGFLNFFVYGLTLPVVSLFINSETENINKKHLNITIIKTSIGEIFFLLLAIACLGLPPFAGFIANLFLFTGLYQFHPGVFIFAGGGMIITILFFIRMIKIFLFSDEYEKLSKTRLSVPGIIMISILIGFLVYGGLAPEGILENLEEEIYTPVETLREVRLDDH